MRLAVADTHAVDHDRAHLTIKHFLRPRNPFLERPGNRDQLERRTRLVDIAHCAIFQGFILNLLFDVGIESRAICQRQDFSRARILHDHGAGDRVGIFNGLFQFSLGNILNFFVDGENQIVARLGFFLNSGEPLLAGVDRDLHAAGLAAQLFVISALDAAQAAIVGAHIAEHLCRQFALGIKAFRFFLEMDSLQIQSTNALDGLGIGFACDPAKRFVSAAISQDEARVFTRNACDQRDRIGKVGHLAGHGKGRIHHDGHGQFVALAVEDNAALGGHVDRTLLLVVGALLEIAVAEDLQIDQTQADHAQP